MHQVTALLVENAADLLFNFAAFLIVYLIARLLSAGALVAMSIAVLPLLMAFAVQHQTGPTSLLALLR